MLKEDQEMEILVDALEESTTADLSAFALSAEGWHRAPAGTRQDIRCRDCGFGAVVTRAPDRCPMCGGSVWLPQ
jgi:rubrerythrin